MTTQEQIESDLIVAMKAREQERLDALRLVKAALKNELIALGHELTEEESLKVLNRLMKQRKEAALEYRKVGKEETAVKEENEAAMIQKYLPAQMDDTELTTIIKSVIAASGATGTNDLGKVMGAVMQKIAGRADGTRVSTVVKSLLQ